MRDLERSEDGFLNHSVGPTSEEMKEWETKKFDFEEFDPKPLEPEDFEGISSGVGNGSSKRLKSETPKPEKEKTQKSPEEQISALRSAITAFSLVGQIGLVMFASVAIGLFAGMYLDRWLGTGHVFLMIFIILGVASGFRAVFLMIKRLTK